MANQIMIIAPYWLDAIGTWILDDPHTGLERKPFVSGMPLMIDDLKGHTVRTQRVPAGVFRRTVRRPSASHQVGA